MEAFAGAVGLGYSHIETDLHMTADDALVCVHDPTVDRTTDGSGPVESFTLEEIQTLDAGFRHGSRDGFRFRSKDVRVPTFEEVFTSFPHVRFVVDLKRDGMEEALVKLIENHGIHDRLIVSSFSDERLSRFREASGAKVATSAGRTMSRLWVLAARMGRRGGGNASALQLPTQVRGVRVVDEKIVAVAHSAGLQVHVWTVNRTEEMMAYLDVGVDGVVTDRPDLLKRVLLDRGQWRGS